MVSLAVELSGLKLRNPIMSASGPTVRDGDALVEVAQGGAGALVTKTISVTPAEVPRPCMAKVGESLLNAELWSDLPLERWIRDEYPKAKRTGLPLIASIGYKPEDIRVLAPRVKEAGADAIELSTHFLGNDSTAAIEAVKAAKETVDIPVFLKLSLSMPEIVELARVAEQAGANGVVAIDSFGPCLAIDIETARPMMGSRGGYGWLSGPALKPIALRYVADIFRAVKIPVIGSGGISNARDVVEFIMAGALAVQISTAAIIRGSDVYGLMADEMARFMRIKGYNSIEDFRGLALKHLPGEHLRTRAKVPEVSVSKCTGCGLCQQYCVYGAVQIVGRVARLDPGKCYGCGLCISVCPVRGAIRF